MTQVLSRPDPVLVHLAKWREAKEVQRRLTKVGAMGSQEFAAAQSQERQTAEALGRTPPTTVEGLAKMLEFYEATYSTEEAALAGDLGLRTLRQIVRGASALANDG